MARVEEELQSKDAKLRNGFRSANGNGIGDAEMLSGMGIALGTAVAMDTEME